MEDRKWRSSIFGLQIRSEAQHLSEKFHFQAAQKDSEARRAKN
jgi:hypothetical protein